MEPARNLPLWHRLRNQPRSGSAGRITASMMAFLSPRLGVLNNIPFVIPFDVRVEIFRQFIRNDAARVASSSSPASQSPSSSLPSQHLPKAYTSPLPPRSPSPANPPLPVIRKTTKKHGTATTAARALRKWGSRVVDADRMDGLLDDAFKRWRADAQNVSVTQFDYAGLVNPFLGTEATGDPGNVCPGASIPFGMASMGIDLTDTYAPAGYQDDINAPRSLGAIHDSGTGSGDGSGGIFGVMPVVCPGDDFYKCPTTVEARKIIRAKNKDAACPGYFTTTLNNSITMETTTTRQAGLQRYTFDHKTLASAKSLPHLVWYLC
ncbi:hypothetical protein CF336_g8879 [Tilletia laevis]|nr:hypothetical protein CF336_g8879 [Tilletia laevis]